MRRKKESEESVGINLVKILQKNTLLNKMLERYTDQQTLSNNAAVGDGLLTRGTPGKSDRLGNPARCQSGPGREL